MTQYTHLQVNASIEMLQMTTKNTHKRTSIYISIIYNSKYGINSCLPIEFINYNISYNSKLYSKQNEPQIQIAT